MIETAKAIVFDLDGTIYYGNALIDGVDELLQKLKQQNKKIYYLTNNSTKMRQQIHQRLLNMGIDCELEQVYTSGYLAAIYIKEHSLKNVFVLGSDDLKEELEAQGVSITDDETIAESLLIGYDIHFNYDNLTKALHVALKGVKIFACNKEKHYPGKNAMRLPGCGAMVGAIEMCAGREVDYVIGKPNALMLDVLAKENNLTKDEIIMVGDTYESDIMMANEYGCQSVLISNQKYENTIVVENIIEMLELQA